MSQASHDLITEVETLKNMLVAHATDGTADGEEYKLRRRQLTRDPRTKPHLPRFLLSCRDLSEFWGFIKGKFGTYAERREFLREAFDPLLTILEQSAVAPCDDLLDEVLLRVDAAHIGLAWRKSLERRATDPDGALTAARTLLETVCKHILDADELDYSPSADLPKLYSLVASHLSLSSAKQTDRALKRVLGGCHNILEGICELRNKAGDAHGRGIDGVSLDLHHAELAVNSAGVLASFILSAWEAQSTP